MIAEPLQAVSFTSSILRSGRVILCVSAKNSVELGSFFFGTFWSNRVCVCGRGRSCPGADPGGALGRAPTPGTEGPAPKARFPSTSSQGQKEGTLVSLEWLFNTIQA